MYRQYREEMAAKSAFKIVLFMGTTREGRMGQRVAKFMTKQLEKRNYQVDVFDPVELKFPLLEKAIHHYSDRSAIPAWMLDCEAKVKAADAYMLVSAEYNFGVSPPLSNMLDHFDPNLFAYKPCGIVTYSLGPYGGIVASTQLRSMLSILRSTATCTVLSIPEVNKALNEEGTPINDRTERHAGHLLDELDWLSAAMKNHRDKFGIPS